ncbi:MAG: hypothetical protein QG636_528 [Patescibacteria group bacterium]|nr:hypothetical protein [Patescibacteria group bacterium]
MIRAMTSLIALISLFIFPWQIALVAIFAASLMVPPAGLALGLIADLVYYSPEAAFMPYFTLFGLLSSVLSFLVHRFVKTRIMEG